MDGYLAMNKNGNNVPDDILLPKLAELNDKVINCKENLSFATTLDNKVYWAKEWCDTVKKMKDIIGSTDTDDEKTERIRELYPYAITKEQKEKGELER